MNEQNQVKSSLGKQILFILEFGILLGLLFSIFNSFSLFHFFRYPFLNKLTQWPYGIATGILVMAVAALLRHTTVLVTRNHIIIRRVGRKKQFPIESFIAPAINRKEYLFNFTKKTSVKIWLRFLVSGTEQAYRLYDFREDDLEQVLLYIRKQRSTNMPVEQKLEALDSLQDDQINAAGSFSIVPEKVRQYERKNIIKIGTIWLVLAAVMLLFFLNGKNEFQTFFFLLILVALLAAVPFQLLHLSRKSKYCPKIIKTDGNSLRIDTMYFSFTGLSAVTMTSPRKANDSIFPVQYWMTVVYLGKKHKFWLGSQASFGEYKKLCAVMEQALVMRPDLLHFIE